MPGPLNEMVLGKKTITNILGEKFGGSDYYVLIERSRGDFLLRRKLSQAIFYHATYERSCGREAECKALMQLCCTVQNPLHEVEWFLARGESRGYH